MATEAHGVNNLTAKIVQRCCTQCSTAGEAKYDNEMAIAKMETILFKTPDALVCEEPSLSCLGSVVACFVFCQDVSLDSPWSYRLFFLGVESSFFIFFFLNEPF